MMNFKGLIYSLLFAFSYALQSMFAKQIDSIDKVNMAPTRSILQLCFFMPSLILIFPDSLSTKSLVTYVKDLPMRKMIIARVCYGYGAILTLFWSLQYLSIGDSSSIRALVAPCTAILAYFMLNERITVFELVLMLVSVIGMIFIAQPWEDPASNSEISENLVNLSNVTTSSFNQTQNYTISFDTESTKSSFFTNFIATYPGIIGSILCIISTYCNAAASVAMRALGKSIHYWVLTYFHALFGGIIILPIFILLGIFPMQNLIQIGLTSTDMLRLSAVTICGTFSQVLKKLALEYEKAVVVQMIGNSQVIFSYLMQFFVLKNVPNFYSLIGAGLILFSVVGLGILKFK